MQKCVTLGQGCVVTASTYASGRRRGYYRTKPEIAWILHASKTTTTPVQTTASTATTTIAAKTTRSAAQAATTTTTITTTYTYSAPFAVGAAHAIGVELGE